MRKLGIGWAECAIANARKAPATDERSAPVRKAFRVAQSDIKWSQSRGGRASQRAGKIERVFREMDEEVEP